MRNSKPQSSCYHCPDKKTGCHTGCVKYLAYCITLDSYKAEIKKKKNIENQLNDMDVARTARRRKAASPR